jgi:membrane protease YdiL (CAAX protease family)
MTDAAQPMNPGLKGALLLAVAVTIAVLIVWLGPLGLGDLSTRPWIAALDPALIDAAFNLIIFIAFMAVALLALRRSGRSLPAGVYPGLAFPVGLGIGLLGVALALALSGLAGAVHSGAGGALRMMAWLGGTVVMLFQASAEEIYFRGWLQTGLQQAWGRWPGLLVAALAFALVHFISAVQNPLALPVLVLAGIWFGVLAMRSHGVLLPLAAHFGWNWGEAQVFGATPNPGIGNFGTLFDYDLSGSALWGGGADGLDTSLSTMFVLTALIVASVLMPGPRSFGGGLRAVAV